MPTTLGYRDLTQEVCKIGDGYSHRRIPPPIWLLAPKGMEDGACGVAVRWRGADDGGHHAADGRIWDNEGIYDKSVSGVETRIASDWILVSLPARERFIINVTK